MTTDRAFEPAAEENGDGMGDLCDDCVASPNTNQSDEDCDTVGGDVCDTCVLSHDHEEAGRCRGVQRGHEHGRLVAGHGQFDVRRFALVLAQGGAGAVHAGQRGQICDEAAPLLHRGAGTLEIAVAAQRSIAEVFAACS